MVNAPCQDQHVRQRQDHNPYQDYLKSHASSTGFLLTYYQPYAAKLSGNWSLDLSPEEIQKQPHSRLKQRVLDADGNPIPVQTYIAILILYRTHRVKINTSVSAKIIIHTKII